LYAFLISLMCSTYTTHLTFLNLIAAIMFGVV
jgi:hypothetical protein